MRVETLIKKMKKRPLHKTAINSCSYFMDEFCGLSRALLLDCGDGSSFECKDVDFDLPEDLLLYSNAKFCEFIEFNKECGILLIDGVATCFVSNDFKGLVYRKSAIYRPGQPVTIFRYGDISPDAFFMPMRAGDVDIEMYIRYFTQISNSEVKNGRA